MFKFRSVVACLGLLALAHVSLASDVYIPAAAAEFPNSNACTPTSRTGANNRNYTVVACQPGQSFFATLSVPQDASSFVVQPIISWITQSTDTSGGVCWNVTGEAFPPSQNGSATTYDNFTFNGSQSNPSTGQTSGGQNRMNVTGYTGGAGIDPSTGMSTFAIHANTGNNAFDCSTQSANLDCRSRPWVVKITRSQACSSVLGGGTADFVAARLTVN